MATNYERGRRFEYATKKDVEALGYIAVRSAGSKTPADLYCFRHGVVVFIQCKSDGRIGKEELREFLTYCAQADAIPIVAKKGKRGRGIEYGIVVEDDGSVSVSYGVRDLMEGV